MYAVIELGGKQYRVEKGEKLLVDRLPAKEGGKVSPKALLYRPDKGEPVFEGAELGRIKVDAVVVEHLRGEKVRVFKYKPKKGYSKRAGHRSALTRLEIKEIKLATAKPAAKAKDEKETKKAPEKKQTAARKPAKTKSESKSKKTTKTTKEATS